MKEREFCKFWEKRERAFPGFGKEKWKPRGRDLTGASLKLF